MVGSLSAEIVIGETHHFTFIAAFARSAAQADLGANHPNDVQHRCPGSHRHHLSAPLSKLLSPCICAMTPGRVGLEETRCVKANMKRVKAPPSVVKVS
jgi:hypothetical protein